MLACVQKRQLAIWRSTSRMVHGEVMHLLALRLLTTAPRHSGKPRRNPTRDSSGSDLGRNKIVM